MDVDKAQNESGDLIFTKQFLGIAEGSYQYKIRIGEDHWVLDQSTESAHDEQGNLNNVIHAKPNPTPSSAISNITSGPRQKDFLRPTGDRKDSTVDTDDLNQLPTIPIPLVAVEKVQDKEQPASSDLEPVATLSPGDIKGDVMADSSIQPAMPRSPEIPLLVVEKTDDKPAHGDDFGKDATSAQKIAHEHRAADASPDRLVISRDTRLPHTPGDDKTAPLFQHESFQSDAPHTSFIGTIDEESIQSSTDKTSSGDSICPTSYPDKSHTSGELHEGPLFSHEVKSSQQVGNELDAAPLLSHEARIDGGSKCVNDEDELDKAPLLSHETGFSDSKGSEATTNDGYDEDIENMEPQHYGPYNDEEDNIPLLPHERETSMVSETDAGHDEHFTLHGQPTFGYETDSAQRLFGGNSRLNYFRPTNNSSTLPHRLPQTDEDDDNLNDPCLEQFPTNRDQILERVQTIGLQFPEDEAIEEVLSPQFSVLSQACSSVELAPVRSHTSLASVPEGDDDDEEDASNNAESPTSAIMIATTSSHASNKTSDSVSDALPTPTANATEQLHQLTPSKPESASTRTTISSEAESVDKHDGTKDGTSLGLPTRIADSSTCSDPTSHDSTIRQRRKGATSSEPSTHESQPDDHLGEDAGPIGRFFTACAGGGRRASVPVILVGGTVVAALCLVLRP